MPIALLSCATLAAPAAPAPQPAATAAELLRPVREALGRGDADDALALLELAAVALPGNPEVEALFGSAYLLAERAGDALLHFERAERAGAGGAKLQLDLGLARWELNRAAEAESAFREAIARGGGPAAAHQLGRLLLWQGRDGEALAYLRAAAASHPDDVDLGLDVARALAGAGRADEALAAYRLLVARAPELPRLRYGLARTLLRAGQREAADAELAAYRALLDRQRERRRAEGLARANLDQAWDLYRGGQPALALARFVPLPESVETLCGIAFSHSALGNHAAAAAALERAVALAPERQDLRSALHAERIAAAASPP